MAQFQADEACVDISRDHIAAAQICRDRTGGKIFAPLDYVGSVDKLSIRRGRSS
jgi:hypothetical protein